MFTLVNLVAPTVGFIETLVGRKSQANGALRQNFTVTLIGKNYDRLLSKIFIDNNRL